MAVCVIAPNWRAKRWVLKPWPAIPRKAPKMMLVAMTCRCTLAASRSTPAIGFMPMRMGFWCRRHRFLKALEAGVLAELAHMIGDGVELSDHFINNVTDRFDAINQACTLSGQADGGFHVAA